MSWLIPRSSFPLAERRGGEGGAGARGVGLLSGGGRLLSHSAIAILSLLVSSLRASFAPVCN